MKLKHGIWTPWAQVLCYDCHGNDFCGKQLDSGKDRLMKGLLAEPLEYERVGHCDQCRHPISIGADIAMLQDLRGELGDREVPSHMAQTGGMCSALVIPLCEGDGPHIMVTDAIEPEDTEDEYLAIFYHDFEEEDWEEIGTGNLAWMLERLPEEFKRRWVG